MKLENPKLWERISRTAETVRSLPEWSKGSERNERSPVEYQHLWRQKVNEDKLFSVKGAAAYLQLSPWTIAEWLTRGKLRRTKVGRRTFIRESELRKAICDAPASQPYCDCECTPCLAGKHTVCNFECHQSLRRDTRQENAAITAEERVEHQAAISKGITADEVRIVAAAIEDVWLVFRCAGHSDEDQELALQSLESAMTNVEALGSACLLYGETYVKPSQRLGIVQKSSNEAPK